MPHKPKDNHFWTPEKVRLLYIGADMDLILSLQQLFPRPIYHVVTCPHRGTAEMFINSEIHYDVLIFDHEMEDRSAFDLARLVRTLDHRKESPVLIVGRDEESCLSDFAKASGGNAYARKAKGFSAIHRTIGNLLAESIDTRRKNKSGTASRPDAGS